jgi:hypothetical protein
MQRERRLPQCRKRKGRRRWWWRRRAGWTITFCFPFRFLSFWSFFVSLFPLVLFLSVFVLLRVYVLVLSVSGFLFVPSLSLSLFPQVLVSVRLCDLPILSPVLLFRFLLCPLFFLVQSPVLFVFHSFSVSSVLPPVFALVSGLIFFVSSPPVSVFLLWFSAPCSGFSSPFYRETCPSTSPAFAGLLFKSRTGSWARDVVHDLLQISCWIGFIRANVGDDEQCFQNGAVVSLGMAVFQFSP